MRRVSLMETYLLRYLQWGVRWKHIAKINHKTHPSQVHSMLPQEFYCANRAMRAWACEITKFREVSYCFTAVCCCTDDATPEVVPQCAPQTLIGIMRPRFGAINICSPLLLSVEELYLWKRWTYAQNQFPVATFQFNRTFVLYIQWWKTYLARQWPKLLPSRRFPSEHLRTRRNLE